jgi:erythronate-4-phosphate dehydrogenase
MKQLHIVADNKIPFLQGVLEPYAKVDYLPGAKISPTDVAGADALFTRTRTRCNAALLDNSRISLIATATIGYDHIDTAYCEASGIRWVNAPGCNASSVQQYIAAAILAWVRQQGLRLADTTLGVVGVGNVGSKVAKAGDALGMRVLLNDPPRADREGDTGFTALNELLRQSDIVTCHTPLTREGPYATWRLASDAFFGQMKAGAFFINSSRGAVADPEALKRACQTKLAGFALDVWDGEPEVDPLLLEKAFVATPHIAGYSSDGKANGTAACVRAFGGFFGLDSLLDWYPGCIPPPPMPRCLDIDCEGRTDEEVLYEAVMHTYPLCEDSRRLKEAPQRFELLRGDYWVRREFACFGLRLAHAGDALRGRLLSLGFNIR